MNDEYSARVVGSTSPDTDTPAGILAAIDEAGPPGLRGAPGEGGRNQHFYELRSLLEVDIGYDHETVARVLDLRREQTPGPDDFGFESIRDRAEWPYRYKGDRSALSTLAARLGRSARWESRIDWERFIAEQDAWHAWQTSPTGSAAWHAWLHDWSDRAVAGEYRRLLERELVPVLTSLHDMRSLLRSYWFEGGDPDVGDDARIARGHEQATERPRAISIADLADAPTPQPPPRLSALYCFAGQFVLPAGREKDGKTSALASDVARAARAGRRCFYVSAEEDLDRVRRRFVRLARALDPDDPGAVARTLGNIRVLDRWPTRWEDVTDNLDDAEYVALDTVGSFLMAVEGKVPETSEGERWQGLMLRMKADWTSPTRGLVANAHAKKLPDSMRVADVIRGSTGIGGGPDALVAFGPVDGDPTARRLRWVGREGLPTGERLVRYRGDEAPLYDEVATVHERRTDRRGKDTLLDGKQALVFRDLARRGPLGYADWCAGSIGQGMAKGTFSEAKARMEDRALMRQREDGRYELTPTGLRIASERGWLEAPY